MTGVSAECPSDSQIGTVGLQDAGTRVAAARLVVTGEYFNLDYPLNGFDPPVVPGREPAIHHVFSLNELHRDDYLDGFYLQASTHIDGLRHIAHPTTGFFGGHAACDLDVDPEGLSIHHLAESGVVGRGVLVDIARYRQRVGRPLDLTTNDPITVADLDGALEFQGTTVGRGDIVLLHTGWAAHYLALEVASREHRSGVPGLEQSRTVLEWLGDHAIAMVAADNSAVECYPVRPDSGLAVEDPTGPPHGGMLHRPAIGQLGLTFGELWRLDALAAACALDGRYDALVAVKPLCLIGGVGSPANAFALR
jgi:kynurenine formamidase